MLKMLFVCRANLNRSPRAAEVFERLAKELGFAVEVSSAGTDAFWANQSEDVLLRVCGVSRSTQLTKEMVAEADIVYALDGYVERDLASYNIPPEKLVCLYIDDEYSKCRGNLDELYALLEKVLRPVVLELLN